MTVARVDASRRTGSGTSRIASPALPSPEIMLGASGGRNWPALARLPERQRSVFMLSHYEGCTSREVSALTGLNESTVRVHLFRAIRRLRTLLAEDGPA
jgi:RNA polymerase sigma-70 factor (ECF subfamily)